MGRSIANRGHAWRGPEVAQVGVGKQETTRRGSGVHTGSPVQSNPPPRWSRQVGDYTQGSGFHPGGSVQSSGHFWKTALMAGTEWIVGLCDNNDE